MNCAYCNQPIDGSVCTSCGAFQLRRRPKEIKLPPSIYKLLLMAMERNRDAVAPLRRAEDANCLETLENGREYRFSLDLP